MDIKRIIRKFFIYITVFVPLVTAYVLTITLIAHFLASWPAYQTAMSIMAAAAIFSFGYPRLRQRVQVYLDGAFFRQFADREEQLHELSREVITHTTPEAMSEALMSVIAQTLDPKAGAIYLRAPDRSGFVRMAQITPSDLPDRMDEENELARYFRRHPQPFLQDATMTIGTPKNTRAQRAGEKDA